MKTTRQPVFLTALFALILLQIGTSFAVRANNPGPTKGSIALKSLTSITFNKDGVLFLADPLGSRLYAIETKATTDAVPEKVSISSIDVKVAALLGVQPKDVKIQDMAVHPLTKEIYLSVTRNVEPVQSVIVKVDHQGKLVPVSLADVSYYETTLTDVPAPGAKLPKEWMTLALAVTDMAFVDGELFVSGLSGEQFTSKLRRFAYPFANKSEAVQLEIFHTSHDRYESTSPIETFLPFTVNGQPHILAGYGCSPVAKFSMKDIRSNKQLRGITLAELGGGNRPLDMIAYKKEGKDFVLIANSDRTLMRMSSADLDKGMPLTTVVPGAYVDAGVNYLSIAEVGIMQLDDYDDKSFLVIKRDIGNGSLNMTSMEKWF
ncbi:MAG TPA: hypothetical protein VK666_15335 [Chryseolinea sp.]|nr:hypothetical protein [Chryseolinea sp.]